MGSIINRVKQVATYYNTSVVKWEETLGLSPSHFYNIKAISRRTARNINKVYPELNIEWLITGKGEMLNSNVVLNRNTSYTVPLLPIAAQGGTPDSFESQVETYECEMIVSPGRDVTLAVTVNGDSMSPEYPNGSKVFVQRVNEKSFIEWGATYLLNTVNGAVIKNVIPVKDDDTKIICRSINPNFADFPVNVSDILEWYRVRCCVTIK